jgi:hypothetical protein
MEIKDVFTSFEDKLVCHDINEFITRIKNSNSFSNKLKYGSRISLLVGYLEKFNIIYITEGFICCEEGLIFLKSDGKIILSKGFFEYYKHISIWFQLINNYNKELGNEIDKVLNKEKHLKDSKELEKSKLIEEQRIVNLEKSQKSILNELDKDGNGEVDVVEGDDFNLLLRKHQNKITEMDRNYIQQFVKISSYIKSKKENIQKIFDSIKNTPNEETLNNYVQILKDDIHSYNLLLFNSLNMIVSLVEDDMITFYEIHERFDNLNIFDSKHERDISLKLSNIGDGLKELMFSIEEMGRNIEHQLSDLSYVTEQSSLSLNNQLEQIDSSLKTNNLLTTINTYQTYKLRK